MIAHEIARHLCTLELRKTYTNTDFTPWYNKFMAQMLWTIRIIKTPINRRSKDDYRCNLIRWLKSQLLIGMAGGVHAYTLTLKSGFESEWGFIE